LVRQEERARPRSCLLEAAVPASEVKGTRYPQAMMPALDSER